MIVRISGEGQWRLPDDALDTINARDAELESALEGDEASFAAALAALHAAVRELGTEVGDEELVESDVILPGGDATPAEVREALTDEGLLPG